MASPAELESVIQLVHVYEITVVFPGLYAKGPSAKEFPGELIRLGPAADDRSQEGLLGPPQHFALSGRQV